MDVKEVEPLPMAKVGSITQNDRRGWLIEELWLENACGIIGGQPKCCKSWLGLEMAVSVASGTHCLGRFLVPNPGAVLVFMAEDRIEEVQSRVAGIARHRGLDLIQLDINLITSPVLRLDTEIDRSRLAATVQAVRPRLLLLDPLVRLHRLDENNARDISGLLGFLRELERRYQVAVMLTHHSSKRGNSRPGQGLRGSSDLHAFGDSNVYLSRRGNELELTVEHRSAPSIDGIKVRLVSGGSAHLEEVPSGTVDKAAPDLGERIKIQLQKNETPTKRHDLRRALGINNQRLGQELEKLISASIITSDSSGLFLNQRS